MANERRTRRATKLAYKLPFRIQSINVSGCKFLPFSKTLAFFCFFFHPFCQHVIIFPELFLQCSNMSSFMIIFYSRYCGPFIVFSHFGFETNGHVFIIFCVSFMFSVYFTILTITLGGVPLSTCNKIHKIFYGWCVYYRSTMRRVEIDKQYYLDSSFPDFWGDVAMNHTNINHAHSNSK